MGVVYPFSSSVVCRAAEPRQVKSHPPSAPSPPQKTAGEKDSRCNEREKTVKENLRGARRIYWLGAQRWLSPATHQASFRSSFPLPASACGERETRSAGEGRKRRPLL